MIKACFICGRLGVFLPPLSPVRAWAQAGAVIVRSADKERSNQCPGVCLGPGAWWQQSRCGRAVLMFSCCSGVILGRRQS